MRDGVTNKLNGLEQPPGANGSQDPLPDSADMDAPSMVREMAKHTQHPAALSYQIAGGILLGLIGIGILERVWPVFVLVAFGLMLAAALDPIVRKLECRIPRTWAVLLLVLAILLVIASFSLGIGPRVITETETLIQDSPQYTAQLEGMLAKHHLHVNLGTEVQSMSAHLLSSLPAIIQTVSNAAEAILGTVIVLILGVYLLIDAPSMSQGMQRMLPARHRPALLKLGSALAERIGGYIRGQVIASLLAGLFSFIVLTLVGVPEKFALAALALILDVLPMVGILAATLAAVLMALTVSVSKALIVLVLYICYHQLESHVIIPQIYGKTLRLPLSSIVVSILIGVALIGLPGVILALPVAAAVPAFIEFVYDWKSENVPSGDGAVY